MDETELITRAMKDGIEGFGAGVFVMDGDKLLVIRRLETDSRPLYFEIPGGAVEAGESLAAAALRELREETGLIADQITHYFGSRDFSSTNGRRIRQFDFYVQPVELSPIELTEHDEHRWISRVEVDDLLMTDGTRQSIQSFLELWAKGFLQDR